MKNFRGYKQSKLPKSDETISQTDPATSCGEYLRRYWHPVALTSEVRVTGCQYRRRYSPQGVPGSVCDIVSSLFGNFDCL